MRALKRTDAASLESAARHLQYALEQSPTIEEAFQRLYVAAAPHQQIALRQLEHILRSSELTEAPPGKLRLPSYPMLGWLLRHSPAPERSAAALFREYQRHESFRATTLVAMWSEFAGFLTYLGAVLAVLIVVVGMYGLFVLPQIRSLYRGFGTDLPGLTHLVFGGGRPLFTVLLLLAVGLLVFLAWFLIMLRQRIRRFVPLPAAFHRIPLVGPVVLAYHQYLWLSYSGLLRSTGMPAAEALRLAATRVPLDSSHRWGDPVATEGASQSDASALIADLSTAEHLGKLGEEAAYQQEATVDTFLATLAKCRRRSRVILTICVYYLVATFVSAMYLPLFSLGSAI